MAGGFRVSLAMALGVAVMLGLVACAGSNQASSSAASQTAPSSVPSSSAEASSSASQVVSSSAAADVSERQATINLDYAAGTGFEWKCAIEPEGVVELVDQTTQNMSADSTTAGGPLRERFTFRAIAPGEVVLTFTLERGWEPGQAAETQVYAFTVTDDLKMILNPYKSDFVNEPE